MRIGVVGLGYVGLSTALGFISQGWNTVAYDIDDARLATLRELKSPLAEPGFEECLVDYGHRLNIQNSLESFVDLSDIIFIAVPTPPAPDGSADLSIVLDVFRAICAVAKTEKLFVIKSTVPIGTNKLLSSWLQENEDKAHVVASNPEFLREGHALYDVLHPDRIVLGANSYSVQLTLRELYRPWLIKGTPCVGCSPETAEAIKYASNSYLAVKVSFANELEKIVTEKGGFYPSVRKAMGLDERIGHAHLQSGLGFGGICLPKDLSSLIAQGEEVLEESSVLHAAERTNESLIAFYADRCCSLLGGSLVGKVVAIWGAGFKLGTEDTRCSRSLLLASELAKRGAQVRVYGPSVQEPKEVVGPSRVSYEQKLEEAVDSADLLVLHYPKMTKVRWKVIKERMSTPQVMDIAYGVYPEQVEVEGISLYQGSSSTPIVTGEKGEEFKS